MSMSCRAGRRGLCATLYLCATSTAAQDRGLRPTSIAFEACTTTPTVGTYKERRSGQTPFGVLESMNCGHHERWTIRSFTAPLPWPSRPVCLVRPQHGPSTQDRAVLHY